MKIKITPERRRLVANRGDAIGVLVRLVAPAPPVGAARPALALMPVVDVSGSMRGAKLDAVKAALLRLLDHMAPADHLGLVAFSSRPRLVAPVVELTEARRLALRAQVAALSSEGNTDLGGGLVTGVQALRDGGLPPGVRPRVILLTDGNANEGPAQSHEALTALVGECASGVSVSAFGYGDDCEQTVLAGMAEAGGGSFATIASEDAVMSAFARELGGLLATYAADLRLEVEPAAGAPVTVKLGDLLHHGAISHLVDVAVGGHAGGDGVEVAQVRAVWRDRLGHEVRAAAPVRVDFVAPGREDQVPDADVARARDEKVVEMAHDAAEAAARQGHYASAQQILEAAAARIVTPALIQLVQDVLLPCYRDRARYLDNSALRGSASAALKKRRTLLSDERVARALQLDVSAAELAMEESFRKS